MEFTSWDAEVIVIGSVNNITAGAKKFREPAQCSHDNNVNFIAAELSFTSWGMIDRLEHMFNRKRTTEFLLTASGTNITQQKRRENIGSTLFQSLKNERSSSWYKPGSVT